jgi:excisionase family DNA binding protein
MSNELGALTVAQFCAAFPIGRTHLYTLIKRGDLAALKCGRRTMILRDEAERWASALPQMSRNASGQSST